MEEKTWDDLRESGLIWFVNNILRVFGWAIVCELDEGNKISRVYPVRIKFRELPEKEPEKLYGKFYRYLMENLEDISNDLK